MLTASDTGWRDTILVFSIALLVFARSEFVVAWDLTTYLAIASNLLDGRGFVDAGATLQFARPGFNAFVAAILWASEGSILALGWAISGVAAALVAAIWSFGRTLYGRGRALVAVVLLLGSPEMVFWFPRHIDVFWPLFVLIALRFTLATRGPLRSQSRRAPAGSGAFEAGAGAFKSTPVEILHASATALFLLIAFFGKEHAAHYFPVPLVLWWCGLATTGRRWNVILYAWLGGGVAGWTILRLLVSVDQGSSSFSLDYSGSLLTSGLLELTRDLALGLVYYFWGHPDGSSLSSSMALAPLFPAAIVFAAVRAWRGDWASRVVMIVIVASLPLAALLGLLAQRIGQNLLLLALLYLVTADLVFTFVGAVWRLIATGWPAAPEVAGSSQNPGASWTPTVIVTLVTATLVGVQLLADSRSPVSVYGGSWAVGCLARRPLGYLLPGEELAAWLGTHGGAERAVIGWEPQRNGVFFLLRPHAIPLLPWRIVSDHVGHPDYVGYTGDGSIVAVSASGDGLTATNYLLVLSFEDITEGVRRQDTRYLIAPTFAEASFTHWAGTQEWLRAADRVEDSGTWFTIWEVIGSPPAAVAPAPVVFDRRAARFIDHLLAEDPKRLEFYRRELLESRLGFDDAELADFVADRPSEAFVRLR
jgi:hypothetical protein